MEIEKIKNDIFENNFQIINCDINGKVTESSNSIFEINIDKDISEYLPILSDLENYVEYSEKNPFRFYALEIDYGETIYCDLTGYNSGGSFFIILQNLTQHYKELKSIQQKLNNTL